MNRSFFSSILLLSALALCSAGEQDPRSSVVLNQWERTFAGADVSALNLNNWLTTYDKGLTGTPSHAPSAVWYRTRVVIREEWRGMRVYVKVRGALYSPQVYLDGVLLPGSGTGWSPIKVALPSDVSTGVNHTLLIRCADVSTTMGTGASAGKYIKPVGGYKDLIGIWDSVELLAEPQEHLIAEDLQIHTSVRKSAITLNGAVETGGAGRSVSAVAIDISGRSVDLGSATVGTDGKWQIDSPFANPKLWSPEHPSLYSLRLTLSDAQGAKLDQYETRFGFKEIWTEGSSIILNGIKRHLLASSTWPGVPYLPRNEVVTRIKAAKKLNINTFRFHISPWQSDFMDVADELGVLIVVEAPVYTDSGSYAYQDPLLWQNYRQVVEDMIRRDRNHASLAMWSLGNEILFMGNGRTNPDLPKHLGDMGRFAKSLDTDHLTTYEADLDPDNAFDVLGLHYPHELPNQHAYPAITDWLGSGKLTEAGGGMLGQSRNQFKWDRKKPLYIGEYLWVPYTDFSPGSVFYGDDAYLNRDRYNSMGKACSWIDQTIAYRRSDVSGFSPWSAIDFGMVPGDKYLAAAQTYADKPVAAYLRNRNVRVYSGKSVPLTFDVFNDSELPLHGRLVISKGSRNQTVSEQVVDLQPGSTGVVKLSLSTPSVSKTSHLGYRFSLVSERTTQDQGTFDVEVSPASALKAPQGWKLVRFPQEVKSLRKLQGDPAHTVLLVAAHSLDFTAPKAAAGMPVIGQAEFDATAFHKFLDRGGRAVILEQNDLAASGLGIKLIEFGSTMAFPLSKSHPAWSRLDSEGLRFWGPDYYVANRQVQRSGADGLRALAVTGGPNSLNQSPLVIQRVGRGCVIAIQTLAGAKLATEPAALHLIQGSIDAVVAEPTSATGKVLVVGASKEYATQLVDLKLDAKFVDRPLAASDLKEVSGVILCGGGDAVIGSAKALKSVKPSALYWHAPTPEAFAKLGPALGANGVKAVAARNSPRLEARESRLLDGVSREDLTLTTVPSSWDHKMDFKLGGSRIAFVPASEKTSTVRTVEVSRTLDRLGNIAAEITASKTGTYRLSIDAISVGPGHVPQLAVIIDDIIHDHVAMTKGVPTITYANLTQGKHHLTIRYENGPEWGGGPLLTVREVTLSSPLSYPAGFSFLAMPNSVATWRSAQTTVVADGITWEDDKDSQVKGGRYTGALLANLGMRFDTQYTATPQGVPTSGFTIEGGSYNEATGSEITMRSPGVAVSPVYVAQSGSYDLVFQADSTPYHGVYAIFEVEIDGVLHGKVTADSLSTKAFSLKVGTITAGKHTLKVRFINDESDAKEDRNLFIRQVGFLRAN